MELQVGGIVSARTYMLTVRPGYLLCVSPFHSPGVLVLRHDRCAFLLRNKVPTCTFNAPPPTPFSRHYIGDPDRSLAKVPRLNRTRQKNSCFFSECRRFLELSVAATCARTVARCALRNGRGRRSPFRGFSALGDGKPSMGPVRDRAGWVRDMRLHVRPATNGRRDQLTTTANG